ncbi:hypothetical protein RI662_10505 [Brevibacillus agri]|uniref:hypothetical protein n=1 Tax=Brevibacillus agri TaxID=51101 RepID=UPI0002A4D107|nr:hypothetical protein [Brevibacillus agri]ELK39075.1 hypothetical protein D478_26624 [Brevibacillus agri BAB-2500]MDR9504720.1 hypothetical protein [Brevibacillus agri]
MNLSQKQSPQKPDLKKGIYVTVTLKISLKPEYTEEDVRKAYLSAYVEAIKKMAERS